MSPEEQMILAGLAIVGVPFFIYAIKIHFTCQHNYKLRSTYPKKSEPVVEGHERWIADEYDLYKVCTHCGHYYGVGGRYE